MSFKNIIDEREKGKIRFAKSQVEKAYYLGEFKENVIAALHKDQLEEDSVYAEIIDAMKGKDAVLIKMRRDVSLKKLKPYIDEAEKLGVKYQLVDGISYKGDVALVVVSEKAMENSDENLVIRDMDQDFIDAGLDEELSKARGKKICKSCFKKVEEKLPQYKESYKKMSIVDKLLGHKCPACGKK
ncbi:DUF1694 domain-containing protein [uncultured Ilyobacter sp.]|uniref:DUF1694 domain-containing protein n=1 Tax=uncultured Ilyobacter sp. TaxID=544433 RepID=UPI0029C635B1|nr:DUF1694 domain-containing protein [uncultured Ilyobacter sp.]